MDKFGHTQLVPQKSSDAESRIALAGCEEHLDNMLDEALEDSFPASDPVSIGGTT
jgi:hypothetical protein